MTATKTAPKRDYRRENLRRRYGIEPEEVERMFIQQRRVCAASGWPIRIDPTGTDKQGPMAVVDHDHTTGKVRGLLHPHINLALGNTRDDPRVLRQMATYLTTTRTKEDT
jgi:hypothetical protein